VRLLFFSFSFLFLNAQLVVRNRVLEGGAPERRLRLGGAAQAEGAPRPAA
jgi:hypothetical protein